MSVLIIRRFLTTGGIFEKNEERVSYILMEISCKDNQYFFMYEITMLSEITKKYDRGRT